MVVCPQVLVGHWVFEIEKYVESDVLRALAYEGTPSRRQALRAAAFHSADVIAMSYETLRADVDHLQDTRWLYCILDEGHLIRNPKSKVTLVSAFTMTQHCNRPSLHVLVMLQDNWTSLQLPSLSVLCMDIQSARKHVTGWMPWK